MLALGAPAGREGGRERADTPVPSRPATAPRPPPPPLCFRVAAVPGCARGGGAVAERQRRGPGPSLAGLARSPAPPVGRRHPCGPGASGTQETAPTGLKTASPRKNSSQGNRDVQLKSNTGSTSLHMEHGIPGDVPW
ncbi:serine/arginine repetitive matrix protein 1-like [Vidua macroura]|uniref:serine/arginine repetitive matrix protein 1-like n=1 Tax=Vidua macroura TaxID=187451 RepID=UPI0023A7DE2C|nr:serine/arginine repetitive matrix protein 1-like [Vidua macroura]